MDGYLDALIWDVGHASAASVCLPNGTVVMLDCGLNHGTGFSPVRATLSLWKHIDALFISHPHMDHIGDISRIAADRLRLLVAPHVPDYQILEGMRDFDMDAALSYISLRNHCCFQFNDWGMFGNTHVAWFGLGGLRSEMNEYSIVTFIQHGPLTFLFGGDLPAGCWAELLHVYGERFAGLLRQTNFFVVPHHGRRDGYNSGLMTCMPRLRLGIISDGVGQPTSVTSEYDQHFEGWPAYNMRTRECRWRKILTTRNDGHIALRAAPSASGTYVALPAELGGRHG